MSKLTKRITAMLLSGMLVIGSVPGSVFAASTDMDPGQTSEIAEEVYEEESSEAPAGEREMVEIEETSEAPMGAGETAEEASAEEAQYYTVTLDANGGYFENEWDDAIGDYAHQAEVVEKHIPVNGTVAAFPVYINPDGQLIQSMLFAGWSLERDGELVTMGDEEYAPVDNCVLYAVWQASETEGAADLEEKGEQEVADKGTEQADSVQETEEVDSAAGDTITAEEGAIEEDTAVEANTDPETENEQDIVPDQQEVYEDEDTENISEESSDAVVSEEETQLELNESPGEEETVREDASNGVVESGTCGDNLSWTLDEEGTLTISGEGEMYDYDTYSIPWRVFRDRINEVVFDDTVERIGKYAFWDCDNLKTIHFPSCLSIIGQNAFDSCSSLTKIVLPEGLSQIGAFAFEYCSNLQSIFIPSSVSSIGSYVFSNCNKQLDISISDSNKAYCAINGVIFNKDKTVLLYYPNARAGTHYSVPTGIKRIYNSAFWNCTYLTSITLPDGLTDIQRYSFDQCFNLTEINIPDSVSRIGECAFNHCALIKLVIPSGVTNIEKQAFEYCTNLTELELQEGVENIGEGAFLNCDSLKSVTIPSSTISISASAFAGCTGLSDLMISEGVKEIGEAAFSGCGIKSITIPSSVIQMGNGNGNGVFFNCNNLEDIYFKGNAPSISSTAFTSVTATAYYPANDPTWTEAVKKNYGGQIKWVLWDPGAIDMPSGTCGPNLTWMLNTETGTLAISGTGEMSNYHTSGSMSPWSGNRSSIRTVVFEDSVTTIGDSAFYDCRNLTNIEFPDDLTVIGEHAFEGCHTLPEIVLPNSLTRIEFAAFNGCRVIESVYIPDNVSYISGRAFDGCWELTDYNVSENNNTYSSIDGVIFTKDKTQLVKYPSKRTQTNYKVPTGTKSIGSIAFEYSQQLTSITFPDGLVEIQSMAFYNCYGLNDVNIPNTVSTIGESAFNGCTNLKKIVIPRSVSIIGDSAFSNCTNLKEYYFVGDAPSMTLPPYASPFSSNNGTVAATIYYPENNPTWTESIRNDHGGKITWVEWNPDTGIEPFTSGVISINYNSVSSSHSFYYDDLFFYADNKAYNNALAILTLGMELASFSAIEERYNEEISEESDGYTVRAKNIRDTYETLGFTNAKYYNYDVPLSDPSDKVAYSFATKNITNGTSNDTLVVIPIRGGGYGAEWASNFRLGISGNSYGFNEAAKKVLADLRVYLQSIEINGNLKLWITGHSRAGATANLLTHYINKEASSSTFGVPLDTGDIYTYAFATPNCYNVSICDHSIIDNDIFNIISANDIVPKIPLAHWGYLKYGQVKVLPEYSINRVASEFEEITGKKLAINKLASFWNGVSDSLCIAVNDSEAYYYDYQDEVSGIFCDEFSQPGGNLTSAFIEMLKTMFKNDTFSTVIGLIHAGNSYLQSEAEGLSCIENMHYMEHYLSWLEFGTSEFANLYSKMPDDERITYNHLLDSTFNNNYKRYRIFCPVDVKVYSIDGELLVNIVDNEIVVDQLPCSVNGDEKSFYLLGDISNYHIELAGNDTGSMSYFVDEYNNQSEVVRSVYYYDIPLEEDIVYQADVSTVIEDEQEDYSVTDGEITTEKSLDTLTDSLESYSVEVENGGSDKAFAMAGEAVMLYADLNEDHELVRWESDDENVIFDDATSPSTFVKMPSNNIKVRAIIRQKDPVETPTDLSGATVTIPDLTFNGKDQQVSISVVLNDNTLIENTDYSVDKKTAKEVGDYQIIITGIGDYEGTVTKSFTINPAVIDTAEVSEIEPVNYTGKEQTPVPTVKVGDQTLTKDTDYTVSYTNNTKVGTATVTITGKGNYTGTVSKTFTISAASIANATVSGISNKTYTGSALKQNPTVKVGDQTLKKDTDYTVSYANNTKVGTATVKITGKGNYTGTVSKTFKINGISVSNAAVSGISNKTYTGSAITQNPTVKVGDKTLVNKTDYTVSYQNNTNVGTATVTITGKGNYASKKTATFKINKAAQSITAKARASRVAVGKTTTVSITGNKGKKSYKSSNTAIATVTSAGKVTAKKVGTVKITATSAATANYKAASKTITIKVVPAATTSLTAANQPTGIKLTWKKVTGANGYKVYRGSTLIKTITSGSTVTFADTKANTNGTKYTYKVVAKATTGDSTLSKSRVIYRVSRPAVSSATNSASKKMTVKWGKNAKANGYQIQYSTDKNFKSGNKAVSITSASTVSKVIGSLTKGKTYYVRIRTYKTVGSTKYWSIWSAARSVKISK